MNAYSDLLQNERHVLKHVSSLQNEKMCLWRLSNLQIEKKDFETFHVNKNTPFLSVLQT